MNLKTDLFNLLVYIYSIEGWFILGVIFGFLLKDYFDTPKREIK